MTSKPVDTAIVMVVGPCIDDTDAKTLEEAIAYNAAGMDISMIVEKTDGTSAVTAITLTTGGTSDWTHKDGGYYEVEITAAQNAEEGIAFLRGVCTGVLPFESAHYDIVKANIYDSLIKGTDVLQVDVTQLLGTAWLTPGVAGTPDVNAKLIGATAQTGRDIGASVLLSTGTGAGQLDFTAGIVKSNLTQILAHLLTQAGTQLADGFEHFFDVATPTGTLDSLPAAAPNAAGGLPISAAGGLDLDTKLANTNEITAARMGALTDWINGGRLDNLLDAIPTTAMRGTDSATLAATWTDARAGYLDNLSAGAVALASGVDLTSIHGAALTETVNGYLAAAFVKLFDVATPLLVSSEVMRGTDGANTTVPDAAGIAATPAEVATALTDINLDHLVKIAVDTDWATTVHLDSVLGHIADVGTSATFNRTTDALEAIRDRGDAAWTTGAGGSDRLLMVDTTIATLASQTSFTLAAGSADDDAYNNCTIVIEDVSTATQKAVGIISDYTGATKTVTLKYDPAIFTMTTTDKVYILAENALKATLANRQLNVAADGDIAGNIDGSVASVVGHTAQTGDSFSIVNHADHGNAKLVRSTAPANTLDVSATGEAGLDFANIKNATGAHTLTNITVPTVSTLTGKSGFVLSATGANLILKDSTFALAMADAIWDEILSGATHNIASSAGRRLREIGAYAIESGTAQAGNSHSITLAATASAVDGTYNRNLIVLVDNTGVGQTRTIVDYNGTTKIAVIDRDWRTSPDVTTTYQITPDNTPLIVDQGIAQAGSATTITLRAYASTVNDAYLCNVVAIIAGTGRGQARLVGGYVGATKVVTICGDNWVTNPDNTSVYVLMPYGTTCTSCVGTYALGQINTECDTALTDYDPPTNTEMVAAFTEIKGATWAAGTDTLEHIRNKQTDIETDTTEIGTAGAGLTDLGGMSTGMKTEVESEANDALVAVHLDHLLAADYDPASKPGVATALLNELVENDGGVSRYTANALEQAPSGGTNPNVLIDTTISGAPSSQTVFVLAAGSDIDDAYKDQAIVLYDASNNDYPSVRKVSAYTGATKTVTLDSAPDFTIIAGDGVKTFVTAPGTTAPTVGQIRTEMEGVGYFLDLIKADTNELQTDWVNGGRLDLLLDACALEATVAALNNISTLDVNAQVVDVMKTDTVSEMAQGAPPATPTMEQILNYLYRKYRNKTETTSSEDAVYDDAGTTKLVKATISDDTVTFTKGEYVSGA
jgi:hypothetical protein